MSLVARSTFVLLAFAALLPAGLVYNPAPTTDTGWKTCGANPAYSCRTTASFNAQTLNDLNDSQNINSMFVTAFNTWNATNAPASTWTLAFGGDLAGDLTVDIATALQFDGSGTPVANNPISGGLEIQIKVGGVTLPTLGTNDQLVWAQGLFDNYLLNGNIVTPFYEMDVAGATCNTNGTNPWCAPAYPYTYGDNKFYDRPRASYKLPGGTQAFFDANVYLSVINYDTRTLTVYDGVEYGFQNYVSPEPGTWVIAGTGFAALLIVRRRRGLK